jgi:hypothetical protein
MSPGDRTLARADGASKWSAIRSAPRASPTGGGEQKLENSLGELREEAADVAKRGSGRYWKIANPKGDVRMTGTESFKATGSPQHSWRVLSQGYLIHRGHRHRAD